MSDVAEKKDTRIPTALNRHPILVDFFRQYLEPYDRISEYNKDVLAEKDSENSPTRLLEKARLLARPVDKDVPANTEVLSALANWEKLVTDMNLARRNVIETTAKQLGITLEAVAERNPETEAQLKELRVRGIAIGKSLESMVDIITDEKIKGIVSDFLKEYGLPMVGREQTRVFGESSNASTAPKYRVDVVVKDSEGNVVLEESGFTKTCHSLVKFYERGKALKPEDLRKAWESAGNSADKTVVSPVEFTDNDLFFSISKR